MSLLDFPQIPHACLGKKGALLLLTLNITKVHHIFGLKRFEQFLTAFDKKKQLSLIPLTFF